MPPPTKPPKNPYHTPCHPPKQALSSRPARKALYVSQLGIRLVLTSLMAPKSAHAQAPIKKAFSTSDSLTLGTSGKCPVTFQFSGSPLLLILFRSRSGGMSEVGAPPLKSGHTRSTRRRLKVSDYSAHAPASPGKLPRNEPPQEGYPWSRGFLLTEHPPSFKGQCRWQGGQTVFRKCNRIQNPDTRHPRTSVATTLS